MHKRKGKVFSIQKHFALILYLLKKQLGKFFGNTTQTIPFIPMYSQHFNHFLAKHSQNS